MEGYFFAQRNPWREDLGEDATRDQRRVVVELDKVQQSRAVLLGVKEYAKLDVAGTTGQRQLDAALVPLILG